MITNGFSIGYICLSSLNQSVFTDCIHLLVFKTPFLQFVTLTHCSMFVLIFFNLPAFVVVAFDFILFLFLLCCALAYCCFCYLLAVPTFVRSLFHCSIFNLIFFVLFGFYFYNFCKIVFDCNAKNKQNSAVFLFLSAFAYWLLCAGPTKAMRFQFCCESSEIK